MAGGSLNGGAARDVRGEITAAERRPGSAAVPTMRVCGGVEVVRARRNETSGAAHARTVDRQEGD